MATDIAFTLGILQLLGKRVPLSLKIFLTAFAIVDDLGAILVIAIFYSHQIYWIYLAIAAGIIMLLILMNLLNVNQRWLFVIAGMATWFLFLKSGIHPTIAGVIVALTIPVNKKIGLNKYYKKLQEKATLLECKKVPIQFLTKTQLNAIESIEYLNRQVQPMIVLFYVEMAIYTLFVRTFCRCNEAGSTPQLTANYKMRRTDIKRKGRRFVRCCRVKSAPCLPGDMMK